MISIEDIIGQENTQQTTRDLSKYFECREIDIDIELESVYIGTCKECNTYQNLRDLDLEYVCNKCNNLV